MNVSWKIIKQLPHPIEYYNTDGHIPKSVNNWETRWSDMHWEHLEV